MHAIAGVSLCGRPPQTIISKERVNSALEKVVGAEIPVLYRVARRLTRNPQEAEDLVGQVLLRAARAWHTFDGRHPRSWMIHILKNEYYGLKRQEAKAPLASPIDDHEIAWCGSVFSDVLGKIDAEQVMNAIDQLPEDFRLVVVLCDIEELSYEDTARSLEVPIGTVRSRLFRARKMLQHRLSHVVSTNT